MTEKGGCNKIQGDNSIETIFAAAQRAIPSKASVQNYCKSAT
jgi:hypothetical protein